MDSPLYRACLEVSKLLNSNGIHRCGNTIGLVPKCTGNALWGLQRRKNAAGLPAGAGMAEVRNIELRKITRKIHIQIESI